MIDFKDGDKVTPRTLCFEDGLSVATFVKYWKADRSVVVVKLSNGKKVNWDRNMLMLVSEEEK